MVDSIMHVCQLLNNTFANYPRNENVFCFYFTVSSFSEAWWKQAQDHASEAEALQEQDDTGLQDASCGTHQYVRGIKKKVSSYNISHSKIVNPC